MPDNRTAILFGAFDRHNFGDLLLAHIAAHGLTGRPLHYCGLAERDLSACGGHKVQALARVAERLGGTPVDIVHVGGEILTCSAWEAAVMLLPASQAPAVVARLDADPAGRAAWAQARLGLPDLAPYLLPGGLFANAAKVSYRAVGGIDLDRLEPAMRGEVVAKLKAAARVGVRDRQTHAMLESAGIHCGLEPDPAVMVAELFAPRIRQHARHGEPAGVIAAFPRGYLAVQCSADFGDDDTLAALARQLEQLARAQDLGIVLFRAGAAPWHDDLDVYRRLAARMPRTRVAIFASLNLWDICALLAHGRGFAGSSLHGGIVATALALPHVGLLRPGQSLASSKQAAFGATWGTAGAPAAVPVDALASGMAQAMATEPARREALARTLVQAGRASLAAGQ
ncbi:polysaccharide pyruvyl transferase family protein [Cupriavidus sp. WKF15]|uniref:polysaccharide pyruvyl transferase family protein n=1 Tax=Cupriavidus sp. WKF15 TaxID=3032282 RepID=UPI0023E34F45|nr:polysaccharide pyruvyl transferase family protein [Cupriavidus sp. WKF15]WER49136.1 polysaccharide pyruvyl transferase family protein [Cupriavidus sp. WKF15]